nr:hypothetical protein [Candidatus Cloacimonadota bacterium]
MRKYLLVCTLLLLFHKTYAKPEIAGYPSLGYSNETGFYGGGSVYLRYRPAHFDENVPKNMFYITMEYSQKKQFSLKFEPEIHLLEGLYTISSKLKFKYWPSNFYGIGNDNNKNNSEKFTSNEFSFILDWQRRISDNLAISLMYDFSKYEIVKMEEDGLTQAVRSFIISTAVRNLRGYSDEFNTMLIHVNRENVMQNFLKRIVDDIYGKIETEVLNQDFDKFQSLYYNDYIIHTNEYLSAE